MTDITAVFDFDADGNTTLYAVSSTEDGVSLLFDGLEDDEPESAPKYWLPDWWDWHTDPAAEIPPGILAICCVIPAFGGGTEVIAGGMHGNSHIASAQQAQAAARQYGVRQVNAQLNRQQAQRLTGGVQHGQR